MDRIIVYENRIDIKLRNDVDALLRCEDTHDVPPAEGQSANFNEDTKNIESVAEKYKSVAVQSAKNQNDKVFSVNVISGGDPLEIYTDRDGEVIFKKYSPIGEMGIFAAQYADTLAKTCGMSIAVFDRDSVIACSGIPKKEYMERKPSEAIEKIMEKRAFFNGEGENTLVIREDGSRFVSCAMPIQSAGDIVGCVVSVKENGDNARDVSREAEHKLIQTAAGFLGRQLEE